MGKNFVKVRRARCDKAALGAARLDREFWTMAKSRGVRYTLAPV
jgi:hypothetical protein